MQLLTANSGSYPRVGEQQNQLRLRKAYRNWEKGEISDEELEEVYAGYTEEVIREQEEAGLDIVTDGQVRWYDPLSHFAKDIQGCEIDGLLRYFDTNFYFRQPRIIDELRWTGPITKREFLKARDTATATLKPVITGPYTLAKNSIDEHYGDLPELTSDFADIISREVQELEGAGAEEIQIDEPAILRNAEDWGIFSDALDEVAKASKRTRIDLYVYFENCVPLYDELQELPIDVLGLDFTYSPKLPDLIEEKGSEKSLGLGLIDARNTKMERAEDIVPILERVIPQVDSGRIYLNPSTGLEYLPRKRAYEKLENMVHIAERAEEVLK